MIARILGGLLLLMIVSLCPAEQRRQGPFIIDFQPPDRGLVDYTAQVLDEAQREFAARLPLGPKPITIVIAGSLHDFVQRAGSFHQFRVSGVAQPAQSLIVVQPPRIRMAGEDYRGTLRHELLHVLLHRNTDTNNLPRWLNEGLCMSYANEYYWQSGLNVAQMFLTGRVIPIGKLDQAFTVPGDDQEFSDAYAEALSMVHFMRDRLGEEVLWNAVLGAQHEDFDLALTHAAGRDLNDLWAAYHRSLWLVALIGALTSGSLLGPSSVLAIIAWWRIRGRNRRRMDQMAAEERISPPPEAWYGDEEEETDEERP